MLANSHWPVVAQLYLLHHQQSTYTHYSTYLENRHIVRINVVYQQILNEVWDRKRVEKNTIDLWPVSHTENQRSDGWEDTQVASVADIGENYVTKVDLFHRCYVGDCEGQKSIEDAETVVYGFEGRLLQKRSPKKSTHTACYRTDAANQSEIAIIEYLILHKRSVVDWHHQSKVRSYVIS